MEKQEKKNEVKTKFLLKLSFYFTLLLVAFLLPQCTNKSLATEQKTGKDYCYLSDIPYIANQSSVGCGSITLDKNLDSKYNQGLITLIVNGQQKKFLKGISAHATSTLVYDITGLGYDYFSTYYGIDASRGNTGNGVQFAIYTSVTGEDDDWDLHTLVSPPIKKGNTEAEFITVDIRGKNYIKLYCSNRGNADGDHAVYANAKLYKEGYKEEEPTVSFIKTIEEYDTIIKSYEGQELKGNYELALLQRELVKNMGYELLQLFTNLNEENKEAISWLMNDVENLRLYILGGTPEGGSYYSSIIQLTKLYNEYKEDFTNSERIENAWCPENMTKGDLYKKMAISLSLTHSQNVGLWMQSGATENKSDALRRYAIYKYMYENGKMRATENLDISSWFEALHVEEMRFVMNNLIDDEEILWLNAYVQDKLNQYKTTNYLTPHPYIAYVWPNYGNSIYYSEDNRTYFNELFAINKTNDNSGEELVNAEGEKIGKVGLFDTEFTIPGGKNNPTYTIKVTRGTADYKLYKVWMNFRNKFGTGCVCGGISKSGSNIRATHGIPATVIGQPGHAALLYYTKNTNGQGYWGIDNDVSGWTLSEKSERMLLGWGNSSYSKGYSVVYMVLAQEAINDYEKLVKCEEQVMLAKTYADDLAKQEEIYEKALEIQPINIDAWVGLINVYNANEDKTEDDYYNLAERLAENLKCFPLPMQHLTNLIKPKLTSVQNLYKFTLLQTRILQEGSVLPNTATDQVLQPSVTRVEANYLLGKLDKTIATFSFDGVDAGKIVLSSRFDGNGVRWDYCITGKGENESWADAEWNEVSFTAEEEHKLQLTKEQINSITAENDIYVHIVGVNYDENNLYKIDITKGSLPANIYANDLENRVVGVNLNTEWRYTENDNWISYSVTSPDLTGNKTVQIRQGATGTCLTSDVSPIYNFTEDNQPDTRKYIPVSHLNLHAVSTQATNNGGAATYAIDANYNTRWHSAWNGTDTERYITIKLDKPVYLSAVEFVPAGGGNGRIVKGEVLGSLTGEDDTWVSLADNESTPWSWPSQANDVVAAKAQTKSFEISEEKRQEKVQFVKIIAHQTNGNWFAARAFNFYQDLTKVDEHPTAGIGYSTTEHTNGIVVARLVNPSTEITITNNDGKDTYVFTENGEFTFTFEDKFGNEGSAIAKVTWIDKDIPSADVDYEVNDERKLVISLDNISEDVYLLGKNNNKINYIEVENGKVTDISYLDDSGNVIKKVSVDQNGVIKKIAYVNTTGNVSSVSVYETTIENGVVSGESYFDSEGNSVTITDEEKAELRKLQQAMTNPLEYTFDDSGDYEFKMLDKASNIAYKSIKADYIEYGSTILASDITYSITKATNRDVVATINPYVINTNGGNAEAEIVNNNKNKRYTFTENGEFTFEYKSSEDEENNEVKEHKAKVTWIDKQAPTAEIRYSTKEQADKVVATLVNESEEIIITNNGTSREHTFTENGEFTFEFEDIAGNKGTAIAKVDWITKEEQEVKLGDIDLDGQITVNDLAKLKLHYIKYDVLEGEKLKAADVDKDGKITINDIARLKLAIIKLLVLE